MEAERVKHRGGCITQSTPGRVLNASFRGLDFVLGAGEPGEGWEQGRDTVCSGCLRGTRAMERLGAFGQGVCVAGSRQHLLWEEKSTECELGCRQQPRVWRSIGDLRSWRSRGQRGSPEGG